MAKVAQCAACNREHQANAHECFLVQHAHDIEQLRSKGLRYQDAFTKLRGYGYEIFVNFCIFALIFIHIHYGVGNSV